MTPKEIVQKLYDCFASGDMETFVGLFHEECTVTVNGMHKFSGTYNGFDAWFSNMPMQIPTHFDNFKVEPKLMIAEGEYVFVLAHGTATGMDADFGHLFRVQNEKISEFHILDDSQKLASIMKAM